MEYRSYADMEELQQDNWWYAARRDLIHRLFEYACPNAKRVLDYGCGVGSNALAIANAYRTLIALDTSTEALLRCATHGVYAERLHSVNEKIPLPDASVDAILAADVLEHVDDRQALTEMARVLVPGGTLLCTVPAHRWLWNWNDDYSHHLRRYDRAELRERLCEAGFVIQRLSFWNLTFVLPVLIVSQIQRVRRRPTRLENNLRQVPGWMNRLLRLLMNVEMRVLLRNGIPTGVSLIAVARKPEPTRP